MLVPGPGARFDRPGGRGSRALRCAVGLLCAAGWLTAWPVPQAVAQTNIPVPPPPSLEPDAEYALPTRMDRIGRVLAQVMVNDQGPFRFILDTGANRSALSQQLAERLKLSPSAENPIGVHGVTGSAVLPAVEIKSLQAGDLVLARNQRVPVLTQAIMAEADGILGIDGLAGTRVDIDFEMDRVTISKSTGRTAPFGMVTIPVTISHGGLLMSHAKVGRQRVVAIIDTGAERTLGNPALRQALMFAPKQPGDESGATTVFGATPELGEGTSLLVPSILIGEAELRSLEVTFADLHVFQFWNLEQEPALLIGMDLLGTVKRLVIDYRRRELQIKVK
jgi:predicted aspartyl protease